MLIKVINLYVQCQQSFCVLVYLLVYRQVKQQYMRSKGCKKKVIEKLSSLVVWPESQGIVKRPRGQLALWSRDEPDEQAAASLDLSVAQNNTLHPMVVYRSTSQKIRDVATLHGLVALSTNIKSTSFWILKTSLKHGAKQPKIMFLWT